MSLDGRKIIETYKSFPFRMGSRMLNNMSKTHGPGPNSYDIPSKVFIHY